MLRNVRPAPIFVGTTGSPWRARSPGDRSRAKTSPADQGRPICPLKIGDDRTSPYGSVTRCYFSLDPSLGVGYLHNSLLSRRQEEAIIHDLIDSHRSAIAKAGVALAEAIAEATAEYSAAIAASEAELEVQMERRVTQFRGLESVQKSLAPPRGDSAPANDRFLPDKQT